MDTRIARLLTERTATQLLITVLSPWQRYMMSTTIHSLTPHDTMSRMEKSTGPFIENGVEYIVMDTGKRLYQPQEPCPQDCCGKGCQECVWTVYVESKQHYDDMVAEMKGMPRELTAFELFEMKLEERTKT